MPKSLKSPIALLCPRPSHKPKTPKPLILPVPQPSPALTLRNLQPQREKARRTPKDRVVFTMATAKSQKLKSSESFNGKDCLPKKNSKRPGKKSKMTPENEKGSKLKNSFVNVNENVNENLNENVSLSLSLRQRENGNENENENEKEKEKVSLRQIKNGKQNRHEKLKRVTANTTRDMRRIRIRRSI